MFLVQFSDAHQFHYGNIVTSLKWIINDFFQNNIMERNSFKCACKRTINATHVIFNTDHSVVNFNNILKLHVSSSINEVNRCKNIDKLISSRHFLCISYDVTHLEIISLVSV